MVTKYATREAVARTRNGLRRGKTYRVDGMTVRKLCRTLFALRMGVDEELFATAAEAAQRFVELASPPPMSFSDAGCHRVA
jgi:hypothetical protein